ALVREMAENTGGRDPRVFTFFSGTSSFWGRSLKTCANCGKLLVVARSGRRSASERDAEMRTAGAGLDDDDALVLGLGVGLDMYGHARAVDLGLQRPLDPVADVVRVGHAHRAGDDKVKF